MFDYNKANKRATKIARQTGSHIGIKGKSRNSKISMVLKAKLGSGTRNVNVGIGGSKNANMGRDNPVEIPVGPILGGRGGVALIFWDTGLISWKNANDIFYPLYNWKCTFPVYGWSTLSQDKKDAALELQNIYAHRIENHGATGKNYDFYGRDPDDFFNIEVEPARLAMEADGIDPIRVFSFADGRRDLAVCKKIVDNSPHEMTLTTYAGLFDDVSKSYCFDNNLWEVGDTSNGISGKSYLATDTQFVEGFDLNYILSLLEYCRDNDRFLIIGGHNISEGDDVARVTHTDTVHAICNYIVNNSMEFVTLADMIDRYAISNRPSKPYMRKMSYGASGGNAWEVGTQMNAFGNYMDDQDRAESGTTARWWRSDDAVGTNETLIAGATQYYTLVEADRNKYLRASRIPANAIDTGYEAFPATRHLVT